MVKLSPSTMCADFSCLGQEVEQLERQGADIFHFDINDGRFVPTITMGPAVVAALRSSTRLPFEVHLQIMEPERHISSFVEAGADIIIVHMEGCIDLFRTTRTIKDKGLKVGVALNPITPLSYLRYILSDLDTVLIMTVDAGLAGQRFVPQTLKKIREAREMIDSAELPVEIEVDGNINKSSIPKVVKEGADILVLGSSGLFGVRKDRALLMEEIRELAESVRNEVRRS